MANPNLYRLGMEGRQFSPKVFWSWILYAFYQGIIVINLAFIFNQSPQSISLNSGLTFNFWSAGMTVYGVCVLLVNAVLFKMTNNYTGYGELLIVLQCSAFWLIVNFETRYPAFRNLFHIWSEFCGSPAAWMGLALTVLSVFTLDIVIRVALNVLVGLFSKREFFFDNSLMFETG